MHRVLTELLVRPGGSTLTRVSTARAALTNSTVVLSGISGGHSQHRFSDLTLWTSTACRAAGSEPAPPLRLRRRSRTTGGDAPPLNTILEKSELGANSDIQAQQAPEMSSNGANTGAEPGSTSAASPARRRRASAAADVSAGLTNDATSPAAATPKSRGRAGAARKAAPASAGEVAEEAADAAAAAITTSTKRRRGSPGSGTAVVAVAVANEPAEAGTAEAAAAVVVAAAKSGSRAKKPKAEPLPYYTESLRPAAPPEPHTKVLCWNVAGLRALLKKDSQAFAKLVSREGASIILLQEHKLQESHVDEAKAQLGLQLPGWSTYWSCSTTTKGYSGVALLSRNKPLGVGRGLLKATSTSPTALGSGDDPEGRVLTAEFPHFFLISVYVPNSGDGLKRLDYRVGDWDKALAAHVKVLEARGKPVVLAGDMNCAHHEIDIHAPATNLKSAGFTPEERASFTACYTEAGMVDTYRAQYPQVVAYTYFTYKFNCRAKNKGWRLDYFLVSESLAGRVHDSFLLPDVMGSDHIPIGLTVLAPPQ